MSNVFLFTGESAFALREEKKLWRNRFVGKYGSENMLELNAVGLVLRVLLDEVGSAPFAAEKRLVMVDGIPRFTKEEVDRIFAAIHPDSILAFWDPKPDKRLNGTKALLSLANVRDFPALRGAALRKWVDVFAGSIDLHWERGAVDALIEIVGENQDILSQEMQKLATAKAGMVCTIEDVRTFAVPSGEQEVWQLGNLLCSGRKEEALRYARGLLLRGEDPYSLWSILLWLLRSLVAVHAAASAEGSQPARIASASGVPFPTVRTLLPLSSIPLRPLRVLVDWSVQADIDLKTGGYRATADAQQEILALVDSLIFQFGRLREAT